MSGLYSLDVQSIGKAGPEVHRALKRVMALPHQEIVARLYQAPSELLTGLEHGTATQIAEVLESTGLEIRVRPAEEPLPPGKADLDVALHLTDPGRLPEVAREVAAFLGCELPKAAQVVWSSPAMLVGQVSEATVRALRERLEPLGVELDLSRPEEASFDLYISPCAPAVRHRAAGLVRGEKAEVREEGPLLAMGLGVAPTQRLWRAFQASSIPVTVLNQDFQRFDLRLDRAPDTPALRQALVQTTGMPEKIVPKVLSRLPMNLLQGVRAAEVGPVLERFAALGAEVSAHLLAFRSFDLEITRVRDLTVAANLLGDLTDTHPDHWRGELVRPTLVEGPFPQTRALWMRHELAAAGCKVLLHER